MFGAEAEIARYDFKVLSTTKTSTMEREMNEAAQAGYIFQSVMGGETAFGGKEVIAIMGRSGTGGQKTYKLLAANKTSTLEKEMQQAAENGFQYKGQTVFESALGGREVCVIMEHDKSNGSRSADYRLLATSRTSTMEKELAAAGSEGYQGYRYDSVENGVRRKRGCVHPPACCCRIDPKMILQGDYLNSHFFHIEYPIFVANSIDHIRA